MFKHLLVPVDGSPTAIRALENGIAIAKAFGASITLVTVYDPFPLLPVGRELGSSRVRYAEAARQEARLTIQHARERAEADGLQVDALVQEDAKPWHGIAAAAQSSLADLIVMGSDSRSGVDKLTMGSVAQHVLQRTSLPVLVVRS